ncbi:hypothetical protein [Mesorhizobium sp. ANAO-SY3R2]|uniref:hypothetical protein n=1 Tax=Mesorhizobium sp. ANAO-SY3R2 TaxID=3166644 RepID=UPI00366E9DE8
MTDQPETTAPAETSQARIISTKVRSATVPLDYEVEFGGKVWTEITVRRVTGKEVQGYIDALARGENIAPPMFECPLEVYDALDDDDRMAVEEAALPFLPRRLKAAAGSSPQSGSATSAS